MTLVGFTGISTWFTYNPAYLYLMLVTSFLSSFIVGAIWILIPSMTGDIVDDEELKSGTRREGAFAAVFSWLFKLSTSVASVAACIIIVWTGFDSKLGADQGEGVILKIRLITVVVSAVSIAVAVFLCTRFPLTTRRIEDTRAQLEAHRGLI